MILKSTRLDILFQYRMFSEFEIADVEQIDRWKILDGHHRIAAGIESGYQGGVNVVELSVEEAKKQLPDKMADIVSGAF